LAVVIIAAQCPAVFEMSFPVTLHCCDGSAPSTHALCVANTCQNAVEKSVVKGVNSHQGEFSAVRREALHRRAVQHRILVEGADGPLQAGVGGRAREQQHL